MNADENLHMEAMEEAVEKTLGVKETGSASGEGLRVGIQPHEIRICYAKSNYDIQLRNRTSQNWSAIAGRPIYVSAYHMLQILNYHMPNGTYGALEA